MSVGKVVGERLEGSRSEEAHRRKAETRNAAARPKRIGAAVGAASPTLVQLLGTRRFRLQAAGVVALFLIFALAWLVPSHNLHVAVDGATLSLRSRSLDTNVIARQAGILLGNGDEVERIDAQSFIVHRAVETTLSADGETHAMRTQASSVGELLRHARVPYGKGDSIYRNGQLVEADALIVPDAAGVGQRERVALEVRRVVPFSVIENSQRLDLQSSRATIASALSSAGVRVGPGDAVQPPLGDELTAGLQVHVHRARPLIVTLPEGKTVLYTLANTIGDALAEGGITLPNDYKVQPAPDTIVGAGLAVHVIGVSAKQVEETERIESHTVYQADADLPYGERRVVPGHDGVAHRSYAITFEDGQPTDRQLASEWYDPEPADTVIYYSTATEPTRASPPVAATYAADWRDLVCSYDWDCDWALAVIQCESGGNPDSYNAGGYVGLFQIWEGHGESLTDPATNIAAAYSLYLSGGPGNWPNCP